MREKQTLKNHRHGFSVLLDQSVSKDTIMFAYLGVFLKTRNRIRTEGRGHFLVWFLKKAEKVGIQGVSRVMLTD